jgi:3-oxoacyl-[acyl-carrier protein] reductase
VTGASRGIGFHTARMLCEEGASVLLCARNTQELRAARTSCQESGGRAEAIAIDVTAADAGDRLVDTCADLFGTVEVLVNNAGTSFVKALDDLTDADWDNQWELNVMASLRLMRAAAPAMASQGFGRIVNVCSSSGKRPSLSNAAYSVAKAAQLSLSRVFAETHAQNGVLVNAVAPGPVDSPLWLEEGGLADQAASAAGTSREAVLEGARSKIPLSRFATPEEIASVIVFMCSVQSANVSGAAWSVDGGSVPVII